MFAEGEYKAAALQDTLGRTRQLAAAVTAAAATPKEEEERYWRNIAYKNAVNFEIRKKYCESDEFAILRQKEEKPEEYEEYYSYCEECKSYVKAQKAKYA